MRDSWNLERRGGSPYVGRQLILIEAATETLEDVLAAQRAGAGRIELCANLGVGGTTPSDELVRATLEETELPVFVMIRPRGGGFVYSDEEMEGMLRDIDRARSAGIAGIVTGVLTPDNLIDTDRTRRLVSAAGALPVTFHRAFDSTHSLPDSLEQLIQLGITRVLTSGGAPTALEGAPAISALVAQARGRIAIIAGGGVREHNVRELIALTGIREIHSRNVRGISQALSG
jgi:copper homeostasis protein